MERCNESKDVIYDAITSLIVFTHMDDAQRKSVLHLCRRIAWAFADSRHRREDAPYFSTAEQVALELLRRGGPEKRQELRDSLLRLDSIYEKFLLENDGTMEQHQFHKEKLLLILGNLSSLNQAGDAVVHRLWGQLLKILG